MSQVDSDVDTASGSASGTVTRALMISPSTAPNPELQLRINTSVDNPAHYLDLPPRYQSHIETVRTAPLYLQPPPRRAFSQDVDALTTARTPAMTTSVSRPTRITLPITLPPTPSYTGPRPRPNGATHGRKISEKFKSIFTHTRKTSEPVDLVPTQARTSGMLVEPITSSRRISHCRNGSAPGAGAGGREERIMRWIQDTAVEGERNPPRPHRSPNTASFIVSAGQPFEPVFPRYDPTSTTMDALQSNRKSEADTQGQSQESDMVEPFTAALYPLGKGLLGTTRRRAHLDDALPGVHQIEISHFSPTGPGAPNCGRTEYLDVTEDHAESACSSSSAGSGSGFDAMWYMTPHY